MKSSSQFADVKFSCRNFSATHPGPSYYYGLVILARIELIFGVISIGEPILSYPFAERSLRGRRLDGRLGRQPRAARVHGNGLRILLGCLRQRVWTRRARRFCMVAYTCAMLAPLVTLDQPRVPARKLAFSSWRRSTKCTFSEGRVAGAGKGASTAPTLRHLSASGRFPGVGSGQIPV
jgi:hypothetical protein